MTKQPFSILNPIIVTKDTNGKLIIVDGQYRVEVAKMMGLEIEYIEIDRFDDIEEIQSIQKEQKIKLEKFFVDNDIDGLTQILWSSSNDKIEKFIQFKHLYIQPEHYWQGLRSCYDHSNNNHHLLDQIKALFNTNKPNRNSMMTHKELKFLNSLDDKITIYRGMSQIEADNKKYGLSWTLDKAIAEKFANGYIHNYNSYRLDKTVVELVIDKKDVVAYFDGREEKEIIYIS
jgi:hypothetical protein